jgi:putative Mg2+ transporter-C (MgtC) family protein
MHAIASGSLWGPAQGQGWRELFDLAAAFVLGSLIGLEREVRRKSAGLRTHALVALGAALFVLVSKFGFLDIVGSQVSLDPSRVAAQIVSGIGFIGAGLIFVRRDSVRGLTTAAVVWVTAAVGAACGAGLVLVGAAVTGAHYLAVVCYPLVIHRLPGLGLRFAPLRVRYLDGQAVLRRVLAATTVQGFSVAEVTTHRTATVGFEDTRPAVELELQVHGRGSVEGLITELADIDGVLDVRLSRDDEE